MSGLSWDYLGALLNSAFITSLIGALAGAFAGARAAQLVAERTKETEQLLSQIRSTNAAVTLTFTIFNLLLALKKQHVHSLYGGYLAKKNEHFHFLQQRSSGAILKETPFEFAADLSKIQMPPLPIDALQRLVFEKLSATGRPVALTASLISVCGSLAEFMQERSIIVDQFKDHSQDSQHVTAAMYFGFQYAEGRINTEHSDNLEGIYEQTNDAIFFSYQLCNDLIEHGLKAQSAYNSKVKISTEKILLVDFKSALATGLIPNESNYRDWMQGFHSTVQAS